ATTEFHKVPKTIASRCQHFVFKRLTSQQIMEHLSYLAGQEKIEISPYSLKLIAEAADGSLRDAETLLDMVVSFSGYQVKDKETEEVLGIIDRSLFENLARVILEGQAGEVFSLIETLTSSGHDLRHFYGGLIEYFRNILLARISSNPAGLLSLPEEEIRRLKEMAKDHKTEDLLRYLLILQDGEAGLRYSSQPRIFLEAWLIKLCYLKNLKPVAEILEKISRIEHELIREKATKPSYQTRRPGSGQPAGPEIKSAPKPTDYELPKKQQNSVNRNGISVFNQEAADELYFRVVKEKPALAPILKMASRVEEAEKVIKFVFAQDKKHFADLINQNLAYLNRLSSELTGREVELKIEGNKNIQVESERTKQPSEIREQPHNNESKNLLQDPKARALLSTLKGQVVAVKKKIKPDQL
ncbi:MAG: hypothetical protein ACPLRA_06840, partial [Candidatus Saccharicenans sp.]